MSSARCDEGFLRCAERDVHDPERARVVWAPRGDLDPRDAHDLDRWEDDGGTTPSREEEARTCSGESMCFEDAPPTLVEPTCIAWDEVAIAVNERAPVTLRSAIVLGGVR